MRRIGFTAFLLIATAAAFVSTAAGGEDERIYTIEMYNAFGIVENSDVRVAGVNAGSVTSLDINEDKRAVVTVKLSGPLAELGEDTTCSSEPQSLIAEYFIDCQPDGPPIEDSGDPENPDIPATAVEQTVQNDLVQNTLREPYKRRLQLLINEFGTALAGNPENLNEAIRLGAPALTELEKVLRIMGQQNRIIRDLNVDSDVIIGRLTDRREDVVRFIEEARDTAAASAERRDDLSRDFELLDDFLAELNPTLEDIETLASEQQPLLSDLRGSASGLNRLALNLPGFNASTEDALRSLGDAVTVGRKALNRGKEELDALGDAGRNATSVAEMLADFFRDIDDPRRAVEIDDRAEATTGRTTKAPGTRDTMGYTGMEGLLNYAYYQTGALNQFDQVGHLLHFSLYYIFSGPCGEFTSGRDPETGEPGLPTDDRFVGEVGNRTTDITKLDPCIGWSGPNQPGINQDIPIDPYDKSVCPSGTKPEHAAQTLCGPGVLRAGDDGDDDKGKRKRGGGGDSQKGSATATPGATNPGTGPGPGGSLPGGGNLPKDLDDLLDIPRSGLSGLPDKVLNAIKDLTKGGKQGSGGGGGSGSGGGGGGAVNDLLDFLLGP
jgi:ABC-type transporter Mla subunit MlaD